MNTETLNQLKEKAKQNRLLALESIYLAKSGHPGGSLSMAEIVTYLYFCKMHVDPAHPKDENRDRFVLSKGHAAPSLYAALAQKGFFPVEELKTLRQIGSILQGHPDMKKTPGVDMTTGSLGQGLSAAVGMAMAGRGKYRVYCLVGDGEIQEGQVWEAVMLAYQYKLSNLTLLVDNNKVQLTGPTDDILATLDLCAKFSAFGWQAMTADGHDFVSLDEAVTRADACEGPAVVICDTVKGKGVSFMEGSAKWHGNAPDAEKYAAAVAEIKNGQV